MYVHTTQVDTIPPGISIGVSVSVHVREEKEGTLVTDTLGLTTQPAYVLAAPCRK